MNIWSSNGVLEKHIKKEHVQFSQFSCLPTRKLWWKIIFLLCWVLSRSINNIFLPLYLLLFLSIIISFFFHFYSFFIPVDWINKANHEFLIFKQNETLLAWIDHEKREAWKYLLLAADFSFCCCFFSILLFSFFQLPFYNKFVQVWKFVNVYAFCLSEYYLKKIENIFLLLIILRKSSATRKIHEKKLFPEESKNK